MKSVNCPVEMQEVLYKVNSSGIADVWIRKNQRQVPVPCENSLENQVAYEADEIYFQVDPELVSEKEIKNDSDFWFGQLKDREDGVLANHLSITKYRAYKRDEISQTCEKTIRAGIDVELSGGIEHFSLTDKDQLNLFGKQVQLTAGIERIEYHQDGNPCKFYSAEDMTVITKSAMAYVSYHTTYCNSMFSWLEGCVKASEMNGITYGAAVPEKFQSEVLKEYLATLSA